MINKDNKKKIIIVKKNALVKKNVKNKNMRNYLKI
jgi:hypothetical protein